jgi:lipoprotein-anchoring transpeptidase ErfK/SrfK
MLPSAHVAPVIAALTALSIYAAPAQAAALQPTPVAAKSRPKLPAMGPSFRKQVRLDTNEPVGTVIIHKDANTLYLVLAPGKALQYRISVGREGFQWTGIVKVGAKQEWPEWRPPADMRTRQPELPEMVPSGPYNPLGARAIYLHRGGADSLYRIHGTNDPDGVGFDGTSGCFRLTNTDIVDLYERVKIGARVVVE